MKLLQRLEKTYPAIKEPSLKGRYITMQDIQNTMFYKHGAFSKSVVGWSVKNRPVELYTLGRGSVRILMWSQMHGNETTTTKALADLINFLHHTGDIADRMMSCCTLYVVPVLNPDGAVAYTRENANGTDLNRDAQDCIQPESIILRGLCDEITPHFCFNLHDQRSIYGVGDTPKSAVVSFLSPLQDKEGTVTSNRRKAMQLIAAMNQMLQNDIPGHVGRYEEIFNAHCTGDTFQALGIPTLLFEAGHFKQDYEREYTRKLIFYALVKCIHTIAEDRLNNYPYTWYFDIPENRKTFFDILVKNIPYENDSVEKNNTDLGIQYEEMLKNNRIYFSPKIQKRGDLNIFFGHKVLNYDNNLNQKEFLKNENIYALIAKLLNS